MHHDGGHLKSLPRAKGWRRLQRLRSLLRMRWGARGGASRCCSLGQCNLVGRGDHGCVRKNEGKIQLAIEASTMT